MAIRRILAPLTGTGLDTDALTLALAFTVARDLAAHVDALYVRPDPSEALPYLGEGMSGLVVEDIIKAAKTAGMEAAAAARRHFDQTAREANIEVVTSLLGPGHVSARFSEQMGRLADVIALTSRLSDLVVFPEGAWEVAPSLLTAVEAALMSAVRPILLAPRNGPQREIGRTTVVAWDGSAESAHALSAALPFLMRATTIEIVTVNSGNALAGVTTDDLRTYLTVHGLTANIHLVEAQNKPIGAVLLDFAASAGAGLLVMGGYGHSRIREFILGGTTRRILSNASIPVFIAH